MFSKWVFASAIFGCVSTLAAAAAASPVTEGRTPVLLELFTSEGCSSCPSADRLLEVFDRTQPVNGADLIVLSEHVDYWNGLGWKDPFSSQEFTERQNDYARRLRVDSVYTPQLVIDGRSQLVGSDGAGAKAAIEKAIQRRKVPVMLSDAKRDGNQIKFHVEVPELPSAGKAGDEVFVAIAENQMSSRVVRGENGGRTLNHVAVVRTLTSIGTVAKGGGFSKALDLPVQAGFGANGLRVVVFVRDRASGEVVGVTQQKI